MNRFIVYIVSYSREYQKNYLWEAQPLNHDIPKNKFVVNKVRVQIGAISIKRSFLYYNLL